eukprot:s151_g44.t1
MAQRSLIGSTAQRLKAARFARLDPWYPGRCLKRFPSTKSKAVKVRPPKHSNAAWVFFGRNTGGRALRGRPEHTDAIQHSGTWHVQLKGEKARVDQLHKEGIA